MTVVTVDKSAESLTRHVQMTLNKRHLHDAQMTMNEMSFT